MLSNLPAETNLICLDIVIKNGIPVTFMISTDSVTFLYCCMMVTGIEVTSILTFGDVYHTVLPFTHPRSGPHTNSPFLMSFMVTGQLGIMFMAT